MDVTLLFCRIKSFLSVVVLIISISLLSACGGGGGGDNGNSNQGFDENNIDEASKYLVKAGESIIQLGYSVAKNVFEDLTCSSGLVDVDLDDLDSSNNLSQGDVLNVSYINCEDPILKNTVNGSLIITISILEHDWFGGIKLKGSVRYNTGFSVGNDIVEGQYNLNVESTNQGFTVNVSSEVSDQITFSSNENEERFYDFNVFYTNMFNGLGVHTYFYGFSMFIDSDQLGMQFTCKMNNPANGDVGNTWPTGGEIVCQQDEGAIAKLTYINNSYGHYSVSFDSERSGNFVNADYSVVTHSPIMEFLSEDGLTLPTVPPSNIQTVIPSSSLGLKSNGLVFSASTRMFYASVVNDDPNYANSIVVFDPESGAIADSIELEAEPSTINISADGEVLYVGYNTWNRIHKISLDSLTIVEAIDLGSDPESYLGDYIARSIAVSPENNDLIVVALNVERTCENCDPSFKGVAVFSSGVRLSNTTFRETRSFWFPDADNLIFSDSEPAVYSVNTYGSGGEIGKLSINEDGISSGDLLERFLGGFISEAKLIYDNGNLITTDGDIINFDNKELIGSFSPVYDPTVLRSAALKDFDNNKVYFYDTYLEVFDSETFAALGTYDLDISGSVYTMLESTSQHIAIASDESITIIDKSSLINRDYIDCSPKVVEEITSGSFLQSFPCAINDGVFNSYSNTIYLSISARQGAEGNQIYAIDSTSLEVKQKIPVGSEPSKLALSEDGSRLYVVLIGSSEFVIIDTLTQSILNKVRLSPDEPRRGPMLIEDIDASPIDPENVVVTTYYRNISPGYDGVRSYIGGNLSPEYTTRSDRARINQIEFTESPSLAVGYNNRSTELGLRELSITNAGVAIVGEIDDDLGDFFSDIHYQDNHIFFSDGLIYDLQNKQVVNEIAFGGEGRLTKISPDLTNNRIFNFTDGQGTMPSVNVHDVSSSQQLGAVVLPLFDNYFSAKSIFKINGERLAVIKGSGLYVINIEDLE